MVDQLTFDPMFGTTNQLPAEGPVVLAWGTSSLLPVEIEGQKPRTTGNVLYYLPTSLAIRGTTTFRADLIRSSVVEVRRRVLQQGPVHDQLRARHGDDRLPADRASTGRSTPTELSIALNFGGVDAPLAGTANAVEPLASIPPTCPNPPTADCGPAPVDGLPEVELFDRHDASPGSACRT